MVVKSQFCLFSEKSLLVSTIQQLISASYELQYNLDHEGRNGVGALCATLHFMLGKCCTYTIGATTV